MPRALVMGYDLLEKASRKGGKILFYLYAKLAERLDVFDNVLGALDIPAADLRFSCEHVLAWHVLDGLVSSMAPGDCLCVPSPDDLGPAPGDIALRMAGVIDRNCLLVICSIPATYEFGLDPALNRAVAGAVMQGIRSGAAGQAPFVRPLHAGRPSLDFPDGWDELYAKWDRGELSSKDFLKASGLKKATFYNKIADYRKLREFNLRYLAEHGIA